MGDKKEFEVNTIVWNLRFGQGIVINIIKDKIFSVIVKFNNSDSVRTFTSDGKYREDDIIPTLFFQEMKLVKKNKGDNSKWRAKEDELYYFVNTVGRVEKVTENLYSVDDELYNCGNYFKSKKKAKKSKLYKAYRMGGK